MRRLLLITIAAGALIAQANAQPKPQAPPAPTYDTAFGAYQRGYFLTAFKEASELAAKNDPQSLTLLAELYANGLGVGRDDAKAAEYYQRAASLNDPQAMFALAMFKFQGRGGSRDEKAGTALFEQAAKLGNVFAAYNLGLVYLEGQIYPQDYKRAAELFTVGARAGNPEAQYALATLYKEGKGVQKDEREATRLMGEAARAGNVDAMVEFGIAQFNGTETKKDEASAAQLLLKAARQSNAVAQNRIARMYMAGRGVPVNATEAIKWHIIAKAGGRGDPEIDQFAAKAKPEERDAADKAAKKWLSTLPRRP
jgi:uncharacterized protein